MAITSLKTKEVLSNLTAPANIDLGGMIPIQTMVVGAGGQSIITFSSIPQNYEHLQIRITSRSSRSYSGNSNDVYSIGLNGTYPTTGHWLWSNTGTVYASQNGYNGLLVDVSSGTTTNSSIFSSAVFDILDYTNINKNKITKGFWGYDLNGGTGNGDYGGVGLSSNLYLTTSAITQIDISSLAPFVQYSSFALYGIKKAGA